MMKNRYIKLTREELFDQVWNEPISKLSKKYGLSDVGLAKVCRKYMIPLPWRGYWAKKSNGKPVPNHPKLPTLHDNHEGNDIIVFNVRETLEDDNAHIDEIVQSERAEDRKIVVDFNGKLSSSLVIRTSIKLQENPPDKKGIYTPNDNSCLSIAICKGSIKRALHIMDALVNALEERGYSFEMHRIYSRETLHVNIYGVHLEISMEETVRRTDHVLTADEKRKRNRDTWHYFYVPQYDYIPTGKLTLKIDRCWPYNGRVSWSDGKVQRVENCLNDFVLALRKAAVVIAKRQEEERIEEERRQLLKRQREEYERRKEEERQNIDKLCLDAENWRKSKLIRDYIAEIVSQSSAGHSQVSQVSNLSEWHQWALAQADRFDPLVESPGSILDMDFADFQKLCAFSNILPE